MSIRDEFEKWVVSELDTDGADFSIDEDGYYEDWDIQRPWRAWQAARAQGEPSSGVPEGWKLVPVEPTKEMTKAAFDAFEVVNPMQYGNGTEARRAIYDAMLTAAPTPEAGQSGGVLEPVIAKDAYDGAREDMQIWKKRALEAEKLLQEEVESNARLVEVCNDLTGPVHMGEPVIPAHPHTNQPDSEQGGKWVRCDERLPTEADGNLIWSHDQKRGSVELCSWAWSHSLFKHGYITHWKPTGLTRPQPPKSKEGQL